ncbi:hypothetical protein [Streptomyces rimosus]|uniref:hypothetical protein n=1 Tax=Streptomyces rimosus TaxID=1927 RepID=UPI000AC6ED3F|nr:hypothetical protein [Streptomyces rimosus]
MDAPRTDGMAAPLPLVGWLRSLPWLAVVALLYALVQLILVLPHTRDGLGWDETVYVSQSDPRTPAAYFSAPRSRGISFLVAPILAVSPSVTLLRTVLALASAMALYGAFRVWTPLLGRRTTALAALLFAGLWATMLNGSQVMPNLWEALAVVAAVGWFLRAPAEPSARWWLAGTIGLAMLLRFPDGCWLALPLLATAICVRTYRTAAPAVIGGVASGGAQWAMEAYMRFGGIGERLHLSSATEGGMGAAHSFASGVARALHSLNGPLLCRPCDVPLHAPALALWWLALPLLTVAALASTARRRHRLALSALPVTCSASLALPYLFLIDYSAPRFFLPAYALLAPPIATLIAGTERGSNQRTASLARRPRRSATATAIGLLFLAHLASQVGVLTQTTAQAAALSGRYQQAAGILRQFGVRPPCLVSGPHSQPVGYDLGCASGDLQGNNHSLTPNELRQRAAREPTAVLTTSISTPPPAPARNWPPHPLRNTGGWIAYVSLPR